MKRSRSILIASFSLAVCLSMCVRVAGQGDLVKNDGITSPLHRANIGKIIFTAKPASAEDLQETDFLQAVELKETVNLNFRAFMANSLTNYLHRLAPALIVDELTRQGNYQFSFFVDGVLVHQENLNPYWVRAENKNKQTIFGASLSDAADPDRPRIFKLFLFNGGAGALTPGKHLFKIELRPYIRTNQQSKVGDLIATGEIQVVVPSKPDIDERLIAIQSIRPNSGWQISNAAYDTTRIEQLNQRIAENLFKEITSVVVIKDGRLLIEEYFNGASRDTLHDTRSVGKSFASTMMGIAINDGHIKSENQTLKDFYDLKKFANYSPKKEGVTLKSLLTMSSAFDGNDDDENSPGNEEKMYPTSDWVKFTLDLPMDEKRNSGERWAYFTAGVVVLGDVLNKSVPEGLEKYAVKKLFKPLGITKYDWPLTPQKVPNTAGGLRLSALDLAKYGQLYQQGGKWNGKQVLPGKWVEKTFTQQIPLGDDFYGYLFWYRTFNVRGKKYETFYATGNGGNKIFVFKDQPLVVVITATAHGKWYMHAQVSSMMERYILPAVINR
ncbi:MAG: serine hydrolase domain-containing protein [Acidobacteriota bacterium]